jgi:hypothetical protein
MKTTKHIAPIIVTACLGCLTHSLTWAQPKITLQPGDAFLAPAQTLASFYVRASGTTPFAYQWFFNESALAGATNYSVTVTNAQSAQGDYLVIVSKPSGSVTSAIARLKVFVPAPHSINWLQLGPDGAAVVDLAGETAAAFGRYYDLFPLQVSSNLVDWTLLTTVQRTNAAIVPLRFRDPNASHFEQHFYLTGS